MTCRRLSALVLAAGFVLSQSGCFGFLDRNSSSSSTNVCGSSCGSRLHSGNGLFSRWFGSGSSSASSADMPMTASMVGMPMGGGGGDCPCSNGGLYQPVGLSGMQSFPGVPPGVPVTVGEAQPLPIQPIPGGPGTVMPPGQAPRIQPVPMAPSGLAPSAGVAPQQQWHP